jgi:hypothetical protein
MLQRKLGRLGTSGLLLCCAAACSNGEPPPVEGRGSGTTYATDAGTTVGASTPSSERRAITLSISGSKSGSGVGASGSEAASRSSSGGQDAG